MILMMMTAREEFKRRFHDDDDDKEKEIERWGALLQISLLISSASNRKVFIYSQETLSFHGYNIVISLFNS